MDKATSLITTTPIMAKKLTPSQSAPTPNAPKKRQPAFAKFREPNEEQLACPWLRQPWDTNTTWAVFSVFLTMNQRSVAAAYRHYASQLNKNTNLNGNILAASRGHNNNTSTDIKMRNAKGAVVSAPTWQERAVAYDNDLAKKLMQDVQDRQLVYAAKAQAHLHNNTMTILDNLTRTLRKYEPSGERIGELVSAHGKMAELIGQLYQSHVPDGDAGKVVSTEQQVKSVAKKIGRLADILTQAKERAGEEEGQD